METKETKTNAVTTTTVHPTKHFPFVVVEETKSNEKNEITEQTFKIAVNEYLVSQKTFKTLDAAERYIDTKPWELIINLIGMTYKILKDNETK